LCDRVRCQDSRVSVRLGQRAWTYEQGRRNVASMRSHSRRWVAVSSAVLLGVSSAACGADGQESSTEVAVEVSTPTATVEEPVEEPVEDVEEPADVPTLAGQSSWSGDGLSLDVVGVVFQSVDEYERDVDPWVREFLEDDRTETLIGLELELRNDSGRKVEWFVAGFESAVVVAGDQAVPFVMADTGDVLRANASTGLLAVYESRLPVEEVRAAGKLVFDPDDPYDYDSYETVAEVPDLTVRWE
jgi:hypothetical protein